MSIVSTLQAQYRRQMTSRGETVTLRRMGTPNIDVAGLARVMSYHPKDQVGNIVEGDRMVILLAEDFAAFPLPILPNAKDRIIWQGRTLTIKSVDDATRRVAGVLIAYELRVSGA